MRASAPCAACSTATTSISRRPSAWRPRRSNFLDADARRLEAQGDPPADLALKWAARLHEIGLDVSHSGYHRHGAYLLENADMPGFSREEQRLLARMVGGHRRKLALEGLEELVPPWDRNALYLIVCCASRCCCIAAAVPTALPPIDARGGVEVAGAALPGALAAGPPADLGGSAAGGRLPARRGPRLRVFSRAR